MKLIYIYDALCGWCYGFSPVMERFHAEHQEDLEFEVVSGGMITGVRIGPIGEVAGYISWAYKDVERATGVTFGRHFLDHTLKEGSAVFTSIPPAVAMAVIKDMQPDLAVTFAGRLQRMIYFDGTPPLEMEAYGRAAAEYGVDEEEFMTKMRAPEYLRKAQADFETSRKLGVNGFPTVVLEWEGEYVALARGYVSYETLSANYQSVVTQTTP